MANYDRPSNVPVPRRPDGGFAEAMSSVTADRILAQIQERRYLAGRVLDQIVIGPHGQNLTVAEARRRASELEEQIDTAQALGNHRHRRVSRLIRWLTFIAVAVVDLPIMLWLASSVFNVDWTNPVGLPLLISVVVSVLATGGAAVALHHLGHNQRQHKNKRRQLDWAELSVGAKANLVTVGLLVGLMGVVMFVRVDTEGVLSGLDELATLLAVLVAVVLVVSALLVFWTAFRDGSLEQEDLRHYSDSVRPHLDLKRRYEDQSEELACQYDLLCRRADRSAGSAL
ncbi:MAG TPA: hypothetical protein VHX38_30955 [Pseudonocardiaceae bacterium]|jgi:hypothetical protein|nr:hypothetical protein [Pseudonocardiaceae bacterium]